MEHAVPHKPVGRQGQDLAFALILARCYKPWIAWNPQDPSLESAVVWLNRANITMSSLQRKHLLRRMVADRAAWIESWGRETPHTVRQMLLSNDEMRLLVLTREDP